MKKSLILFAILLISHFRSFAQLEGYQDLLDLTGIITGSDPDTLMEITQTKINGTLDMVQAGHKGLFFLRVRSTNFVGCINFYLQQAPVLQLTNISNFDTGDIYVICDEYDAIGIGEYSGTVTIEGWKHQPNP